MIYTLLGDLVVVVHFAFILFVVAGALLAFRWKWIPWLHLPALFWGGFVEVSGRICPLTPLEKWFREAGGGETYTGGFIEHYLVPVVYPEGLTRELQLMLAGGLVVVNGMIYGLLLRRKLHTTVGHSQNARLD